LQPIPQNSISQEEEEEEEEDIVKEEIAFFGRNFPFRVIIKSGG